MRGMKNGFLVLGWLILGLVVGGPAMAEDAALRAELDDLKARVQALEARLGQQDDLLQSQKETIRNQQAAMADYESRLTHMKGPFEKKEEEAPVWMEGLEISAGGTMVVQGTSNVNNAAADIEKKVSRTDAAYSADIMVEREIAETGGTAFLHLEAGGGTGLDDDLTLYSPVNYDAADSGDNLQVSELWYEQSLARDRAAITIGKMTPLAYFDNNEIANDETTQFLSTMFNNSPVIEFPGYSAGVRVGYLPVEAVEIDYAAFDGDGDWERLADRLFQIAQIGLTTNPEGRTGHYRVLGWHSQMPHTRWMDLSKEKEAAYGFGLSFDQALTDAVTAFCRYGWQDPRVYNPDVMATGDHTYSLEQAWSAGLQVEGASWGREQDVLGLAVGQVFASPDYKKAGSSTVSEPNAKAEGHLEAYYRIAVNKSLSISPDVQYIWNPFGQDVADDTAGIFIGGMRTQVDF